MKSWIILLAAAALEIVWAAGLKSTAGFTRLWREGEVVPVLEASGAWLRVEDNAGARGWAHSEDVRRLDAPPGPARD
mgnify:CR=1 FL=1